MSFLTSRLPTLGRATTSRLGFSSIQAHRHFSARPATMAATLNSESLSRVTDAEKKITGQDEPVKGGPTAQAQKHANEPITSQALHDITEGEKKITGGERVKGGPTSTAQSILSKKQSPTPILDSKPTQTQSNTAAQSSQRTTSSASPQARTGNLDSPTISKITDAEKNITGSENPLKGGPTSQAQKHANEPITSQALHDITEGEKKITGGQRVKGGPTSAAQSELGKSRA